MSKYTTSIEVIINSQSSQQYNIYERIEEGRHFLFDFDYIVPNGEFKKAFETQFIEMYWQECIGFETVPLFKLKLKQRLEMLMPEVIYKYNTLAKIMAIENPNIERSGTSRDTHNTRGTTSSTGNSTIHGSGNTTSNNTATGTNKSINSELPSNLINASSIDSVTYADNGSISESTSSDNNTSTNTNDSTGTSSSSTEHHDNTTIEHQFNEYGNELKGYIEYYKAYVNIMKELLYSFGDMFIQLLY